MGKDQKKDIKKKEEVKETKSPKSVLVDEDQVKKEDKKKATDKKEVKEVKARARFLKVSPKKAKLVIDEIRGLQVDKALEKLSLINKWATRDVVKLLNSAIANAENNFELNRKDLYINHIAANQGPTLHRWKPAAFGRAHPIRKRTAHLDIILGFKKAKAEKEEKPEAKKENKKSDKKADKKGSKQSSDKAQEPEKII
ncbi:MAG: 50S ribosomal protein L22 [Candidatus Komeilibacteria bacterium CG10_big_fil_rev_8_21_14_0_10_41_13]|uniref:Large ribosomal subunit protein uL22 n=1 Tax=Candidatus Komeilibacteria bacterium CG10_big_fil_rev_8_21_14_0_10_41_13 TaxID=1974476 RepID=A0A2M6WDE9_9BACT|nr:MAG: 50S ribosomal protein L22 [Candidatus Komeilibacteria bacterium CG10_big_fil_rev_8_21_14_0_10_41_13]